MPGEKHLVTTTNKLLVVVVGYLAVLDILDQLFGQLSLCPCYTCQAANLAGFRASEDPRFEAGIPDFMNGILNFSIHFNVVHRKVDWRNAVFILLLN